MELYDELAAAQPAAHESEAEVRGGWAYYTRSPPRRDLPLFCRRPAGGGAEQILLDLGALADRHGYAAIGKLAGSPDGRSFAYTLDLTGREEWQLIIADAATGAPAAESTDGVLNFEWASGSEALVYTSLDERGRPSRALVCALGVPCARDRLLLEEPDGAHLLDVSSTRDGGWIALSSHSHFCSEVRLLPADSVSLQAEALLVAPREEGLHYVVEGLSAGHLLIMSNGVESCAEAGAGGSARANLRMGAAPAPASSSTGLGLSTVHVSELPAPRASWATLRAPVAGAFVEDIDVGHGWLGIYERVAAVPRLSVAWLQMADPQPSPVATWPRASPARELGGADPRAAQDAAQPLVGAAGPTHRPFITAEALVPLPASPGPCHLVPVPSSDFCADELVFQLSSPRLPPTTYAFRLRGAGQGALTIRRTPPEPHRRPHAPIESSEPQIHSEVRWARADDGERIPVTVAHRCGLVASGDAPMLVYVYGAYGASLTAEYRPEWLPLLRRGWVLALAHVRGGGELGPRWHAGGRRLHKGRSAADLECALRALHAWGYSRPALSAARAASAGGIALGGLLNMAPDLVGAAVMHSPFLDPLGAMLDASLPLTLEERGEWGDPRTDAAAREAIAKYAPYDNLPYCYSQDGGAFEPAASTTGVASPLPPLLICAARNDPRVPCSQALRYVNRARRRSTPPGVGGDAAAGPLLLHVQSAAGHHGDGGRFRRLEGFAMEWAFLIHALHGEDVAKTHPPTTPDTLTQAPAA